MERQQEVVAGERGAATAPDEQSGALVSPGDPIARAAVPAMGEE